MSAPVFLFGFGGGTEWLVIGGVALLLFGSTRLPKLARSLGQSLVEFKKGIKADPDPDDAKDKIGAGDDPERIPEESAKG